MSKNILVVDDAEENVLFITEMLQEQGYDTRVARNGEAALAEMRKAPPDLVVLDLMMPKKNGALVAREMQRDDGLKAIPIVICTGASAATGVDIVTGQKEAVESYSDQFNRASGERIHAKLRGLDPRFIIEKPIDPGHFMDTVNGILG